MQNFKTRDPWDGHNDLIRVHYLWLTHKVVGIFDFQVDASELS